MKKEESVLKDFIRDKKKLNYWKVATIILGIIFIFLLLYSYIFPDRTIQITEEFSLKESQIETLYKSYGNQTIKLCNLDSSKCIPLKING